MKISQEHKTKKYFTCPDTKAIEVVTKAIESLDFIYWIDSGTLLGLYRDANLIKSDKDIDISLINNDKNIYKLVKLLRSLNLGKLLIKKFDNKIHKIKIIQGQKKRTIDISIFLSTDEHLMMPVLRLEKISETIKKYRFILATKLILAKTYIEIRKFFFENIEYKNKFLIPLLRVNEIWRYPINLILPVKKLSRSSFSCPSNVEAFLEFRYGDWKKPVQGWKSEFSDKGFTIDEEYSKLL